MELENRLALFREMILCCHNFYLWVYDLELDLLESNCPEIELVQNLFRMGDGRQTLLNYAREHAKPIIMSNPFGLMWIAVPYHFDDNRGRVFILGPFFSTDLSERVLSDIRKQYRQTAAAQEQIKSFLQTLPVFSQSRYYEYAIMFYYCVTGERVSVSDLHYQESEPVNRASFSRSKHTAKDQHGTYAMEQEMVRMVREGNLNYQKHMNRMAVSGTIGKLSDDPDRQMKNAVLVCIILFSRAAIEGGLSPEIAMTLTDHYFQGVENSGTLQELQTLARTMQDDFVMRVHRIRNSTISKPIQEACDYIDLHLEENPSLSTISKHTKYSECYLSRKFREEIGTPVGVYVMKRRLERAADLLRDNKLTVKEIGERLNFCSPSYFSKHFKAVYGLVPSEWREQHMDQ